jgi:MerR family transcriptional regulator, repressor of the yfmOP operon
MVHEDSEHRGTRLADKPDVSEAELPPGSLLIGQVSERTGLTQRTLRYYEELGLVPHAPRLEGGFRLYSEADIARLQHIVELKRVLGFSLLEIKAMVEAEEERREQRHAFHREVDPEARRARAERALEIALFELAKLNEHRQALEELTRKTEARVRRYESELRASGGEVEQT